jgi:hypothetical protein
LSLRRYRLGKRSRTKGHTFERQIAEEFREIGFPDAQTTRATSGGNWQHSDEGIDLAFTGDYFVQVKRFKTYRSVETINEIDPALTNRILITKADRKPAMAVMRWDDLKELIRYRRNTELAI